MERSRARGFAASNTLTGRPEGIRLSLRTCLQGCVIFPQIYFQSEIPIHYPRQRASGAMGGELKTARLGIEKAGSGVERLAWLSAERQRETGQPTGQLAERNGGFINSPRGHLQGGSGVGRVWRRSSFKGKPKPAIPGDGV